MQPKPKFETNVKTIARSQLVSGAKCKHCFNYDSDLENNTRILAHKTKPLSQLDISEIINPFAKLLLLVSCD
jgi:hypothetical protein